MWRRGGLGWLLRRLRLVKVRLLWLRWLLLVDGLGCRDGRHSSRIRLSHWNLRVDHRRRLVHVGGSLLLRLRLRLSLSLRLRLRLCLRLLLLLDDVLHVRWRRTGSLQPNTGRQQRKKKY